MQGAGRGFGWNSGSRAPEGQAASDSALGPGTQPRAGLRREASGENAVGALNKTLWVPGLSFPALKSRTGPMSFPWYLGSPKCGRRVLGTAWPTRQALGGVWGAQLRRAQLWVFLSRGTHGLGSLLHSTRAGNSDHGCFFSLERVVGKRLEFGPSEMSRASGLPHSVNGIQQASKSPGTEIETETGALCSIPLVYKVLPTQDLIVVSQGIGRIGISVPHLRKLRP